MNHRRNPILRLATLILFIVSILGVHQIFFTSTDQQTIATSQSQSSSITTVPTMTMEPSPTIAPSPTPTQDPNGFSIYQKVGSHESAQCGKNVKVSADNSDLRKYVGGGTLCQTNSIYNGVAIGLNLPKGSCGIIAGTELDIQYPNGGEVGFGPQWVADMACNTKYIEGYEIYGENITSGEIYISSNPDQVFAKLHTMIKIHGITNGNTMIEISNKTDCSNYSEFFCSELPPNGYQRTK